MDSQNLWENKPLFMRKAADGRVWEFGVTFDGRCGIVCNGEMIVTSDGQPESVDKLLGQFLRATALPSKETEAKIGGSMPGETPNNSVAA